jgi:hypothetical protein
MIMCDYKSYVSSKHLLMEVVIFLQHLYQVRRKFFLSLIWIFYFYKIDLKNFLQLFTIHDNIQVAYQCCSTTLRIILKYRNTSNISSSSQNILDDLIEHLNTALAVLLTEVIQSNSIKELQVCLSYSYFFTIRSSVFFFFLGYVKFNWTIITSI